MAAHDTRLYKSIRVTNDFALHKRTHYIMFTCIALFKPNVPIIAYRHNNWRNIFSLALRLSEFVFFYFTFNQAIRIKHIKKI